MVCIADSSSMWTGHYDFCTAGVPALYSLRLDNDQMTLRIDNRIGSVELAPLFQSYGIKPIMCRLEFGDLEFHGQGQYGTCVIAVERKRINDLISSIQSKRLSGHQLPGMARQYDYAYLIVEGVWRPASNGQLEIRSHGNWSQAYSGQVTYRQIDNYLSTLEIKSGMIYRRTYNEVETVAVIVDLMRWWDKPWDEHHSHDIKYQPADGPEGKRLRMVAPTQVELVARTLPGMDLKAKRVAKRFKSVKEMVMATEEDWCEIDGIGPILARRIVEALNGKPI